MVRPVIDQILPNFYRMEIPLPKSPLRYLNSYVIKGPRHNLVIDTGLNRRACLEAFQAGAEVLEIEPDKTDFLITHLHSDHFALVSKVAAEGRRIFLNRPDAEFLQNERRWEEMAAYASKNGIPRGEMDAVLGSHPASRYGYEVIPPLTTFGEKDQITIGEYAFRCIETPGHSYGHTCLYEPEKKILVSGDHLLNDITPVIQCWGDRFNPLKSYLASLEKVLPLDVDLVLPGHRRVYRSHRARVEELKRHHQRRLDEVGLILQRGARNAYGVASEMTWDIRCEGWDRFPPAQKWFAVGEAIAHLRFLESEGKAERETGPEGITYRLT